jgi:hypothetical protein
MTINYVINVVGSFPTRFFLLKGERIKDDYIIDCMPWICMARQKKHGQHISFSRVFFLTRLNLGSIFKINKHLGYKQGKANESLFYVKNNYK